jgi:hypothetical protein
MISVYLWGLPFALTFWVVMHALCAPYGVAWRPATIAIIVLTLTWPVWPPVIVGKIIGNLLKKPTGDA